MHFREKLIIPGVNQPAPPDNQSRYIDSPYHHAIVVRHAAAARHPQQHAAAAAAGAALHHAAEGAAADNLDTVRRYIQLQRERHRLEQQQLRHLWQ